MSKRKYFVDVRAVRGLLSFQRTKTTIKHGKKTVIVWFIQSPLKWYYIFTWGTAQNLSSFHHRFLIGEDVLYQVWHQQLVVQLIFVIQYPNATNFDGSFLNAHVGRGSKGPFSEKLTNLRHLIREAVRIPSNLQILHLNTVYFCFNVQSTQQK